MDAAEIIARLEEPVDDERAVYEEVRDSAPVQALLDALATAAEPWTRMLVADMLGERHERAALEPLLAALDDPDERVRWGAAEALHRLFAAEPPPAETAAAVLARYETEGPDDVGLPLGSALGAAGYRPAIPALRRALDSDEPAAVFVAREALHRLEGAPPVAAEEIVELLERDVEDGRPLTGRLLLGASTEVLVDAFTRARKALTRTVLADLLGFRGDAAATDVLVDALGDADWGVRASVADALGKVVRADPPPRPETLQRAGAAMLERFEIEPRPEVRDTLATAVAAAGYRPAIPALRAALGSEDANVARQARWGLHILEGTPPPD